MFRIRTCALLAVVALTASAGCGGNDVETFEDPVGKIEVEEGKAFAIELRVNAGVGYEWKAVGVPAGIALMKLKKTTVDYPDDERAGDSGTKRFEYEALGRGIQTLTFQRYFRGKPDERRTVNVSID